MRSWESWLLFGLPAAVTLGSLATIAIDLETLWPWLRVVHEDGARTLLGTIFYFEHATRELPLDLVLAVGIAGAVLHFNAPPAGVAAAGENRRRLRLLGIGSLLSIALVLGGTVAVGGMGALWDNLGQMHTRPGAPLVWGAHWRFHLLSRLALLLLCFSAVGVLALLSNHRTGESRGRLFGGSLAGFGLLSLIFGLTTEPFRDAIFLGHQARELFTHAVVSVPLSIGVCLWVIRSAVATHAGSGEPGAMSGAKPGAGVATHWPIVATGLIGVAIALFLLIAGLASGAQSKGQTTNITQLVFVHFFEHSPGYLIVAFFAGFITLLQGSRVASAVNTGRASNYSGD